jgi:hypothetical protein
MFCKTEKAKLIDFVNQLYEIHSTIMYGFNVNERDERENLDRCRRWMDAVLPEVISKPDEIKRQRVDKFELPFE